MSDHTKSDAPPEITADEIAAIRNRLRQLDAEKAELEAKLGRLMGVKQCRAVMGWLEAVPPDAERVLIATGRYIGEGFDDPRLDTLFLAMPISWKGTLAQYVGRLHRLHPSKREVVVYDYIDAAVPVLARMSEKRIRGYKGLGYTVGMKEETMAEETRR